jgi:hypothetical protein
MQYCYNYKRKTLGNLPRMSKEILRKIREFKLHVSGNGKRQVRTFLGKIFIERFRFIFSFLRWKNNHALQF